MKQRGVDIVALADVGLQKLIDLSMRMLDSEQAGMFLFWAVMFLFGVFIGVNIVPG